MGPGAGATPRDIHYPVLFVAPATAPNLQALGFDFASDPHRREAIEAAIRSRLTTATDPITFVLEPGAPKEIRLFQPVFDEFGEMRGFAVAALRADAILLSDGPDTATLLEIEFVDESGTPPLLASNRTMDGPRPAGPSFTRVIPIFGEVFAINASAGPDFLSRHPIRAGWFTALTGLPSQKEQLNPKEHKGVQCLASMTTFTPGVNIVRIAIYRFPSCPLRLCGSKCRI